MLFGIAGLFGYHFCYFSALRLAPAAEAGLIAYLWPLFIVLLSGLLPGERIGAPHVLGALLAFAGVALILIGGGGAGFQAASLPGYGLALACAVIWAIYSVGSRRFGNVPTEAVTIFCLVTAVLSGLSHLALEATAWPQGAGGWLAVLALGLGPLGAAFFTWDIGMKRGDLPFLGVASYAAPLLSTLILVLSGTAAARWQLAAAAVLIVGGAALAARAGSGVNAAKDG
jgi:drug/metabolite transporter (DMT)-like permease